MQIIGHMLPRRRWRRKELDKHGMLSHKYAYALLHIYEYFGKKGMLQSNEEEISRLAKLSKME